MVPKTRLVGPSEDEAVDGRHLMRWPGFSAVLFPSIVDHAGWQGQDNLGRTLTTHALVHVRIGNLSVRYRSDRD